MGENVWRPVIAALVNDAARTAYARLVLGATESEAFAGLSASRARHARDALVTAGLVIDRDGVLVADDTALVGMLRTTASRPTGVARFFGADGRIDRYPSSVGERVELLRSVAQQVLEPGEVLTEAVFTDRLTRFTDDAALLRRHLVDHGIVERTRSGSEYALASE